MIKMWKIAHAAPNGHCVHQGNSAIKIKINSPANKFPYSRSDNDKGFTPSSKIRNTIFNGNNFQPKGLVKISLPKPMPPFPLKL